MSSNQICELYVFNNYQKLPYIAYKYITYLLFID